jgi:hypothetical protein
MNFHPRMLRSSTENLGIAPSFPFLFSLALPSAPLWSLAILVTFFSLKILFNKKKVDATPPPIPTSFSVTPSPGTLSLSWVAPTTDNGAYITGYSITCDGDFGAHKVASVGAVLSHTITSLVNGETFSCTIGATNSAGTGTLATANGIIVGALPTAPSVASVTRGDLSAIVAWNEPDSWGVDTPVDIDVEISCINQADNLLFQSNSYTWNVGDAKELIVSSLTRGQTYACRLTVTTIKGTSPESADSSTFVAATTPVAPSISLLTPGNAKITEIFALADEGG